MITKAIVVEKLADDLYKIRIPLLDKIKSASLDSNSLQVACPCKQISGDLNYSVNDIVYIDFEDNDIYNPVILGKLYCQSNNNSLTSMDVNSFTVDNSAKLSNNILINGSIDYTNISNLQNLSYNIQEQIDKINIIFNDNENLISTIISQYKNNEIKLDNFKVYLDSINKNIGTINRLLGKKDSKSNATLFGKLNNLLKNIDDTRAKIGNVGNTTIFDEIRELQYRLAYLQKQSPKISVSDEGDI